MSEWVKYSERKPAAGQECEFAWRLGKIAGGPYRSITYQQDWLTQPDYWRELDPLPVEESALEKARNQISDAFGRNPSDCIVRSAIPAAIEALIDAKLAERK